MMTANGASYGVRYGENGQARNGQGEKKRERARARRGANALASLER